MANPVIEAEPRAGVGKGAARTARREGFVPGVIYGGGKDPEAINIRHNVLLKMLKAGKFRATLLTMKVGDAEQTVICRDVQRDVVKDLPIHADFLRLSERSRINLYIPVEFVNEENAPGLRAGGVLAIVRNEVELKVRAGNIPEKLVADLSGMEIGDTLTISSIGIPSGASVTITDRDFVIANISPPSGLASQKDDDEEGAEDGAEEASAEGASPEDEASAG